MYYLKEGDLLSEVQDLALQSPDDHGWIHLLINGRRVLDQRHTLGEPNPIICHKYIHTYIHTYTYTYKHSYKNLHTCIHNINTHSIHTYKDTKVSTSILHTYLPTITQTNMQYINK